MLNLIDKYFDESLNETREEQQKRQLETFNNKLKEMNYLIAIYG